MEGDLAQQCRRGTPRRDESMLGISKSPPSRGKTSEKAFNRTEPRPHPCTADSCLLLEADQVEVGRAWSQPVEGPISARTGVTNGAGAATRPLCAIVSAVQSPLSGARPEIGAMPVVADFFAGCIVGDVGRGSRHFKRFAIRKDGLALHIHPRTCTANTIDGV